MHLIMLLHHSKNRFNQSVQLFCTMFTNVNHSCVVCRYIKIKPQISPFGQWPSLWDWPSPDPPFIATLSLGMVNSCVLLLDNDPLLRNGQVQVLLSDNDPLLRNGQVQVLLSDNDPFLGIRQVKILLSSRPFPWEWSSPDYDPLLANGQIQFFVSSPSPWEWSSIAMSSP